jgi:hypothetical protein
MAGLIYKVEIHRIMGACFEVYKEMGCGFLEPVYQECLQLEFETRGVPGRPQIFVRIAVGYKIDRGRLVPPQVGARGQPPGDPNKVAGRRKRTASEHAACYPDEPNPTTAQREIRSLIDSRMVTCTG